MLSAGRGNWSGQLGQIWKILASGQRFLCLNSSVHTPACWFWLVYCSLPVTSQPEWKQQNSSRVNAAEPNSPGLVCIMAPSCFCSSKTTDKRDVWVPVSREGFLETRGRVHWAQLTKSSCHPRSSSCFSAQGRPNMA